MVLVIGHDGAGDRAAGNCRREEDEIELAAIGVLSEDPLVDRGHAGELVMKAVDEVSQIVHRSTNSHALGFSRDGVRADA